MVTWLYTCRIPEFSEFWRDLLQQPQSLCPQLSGESAVSLWLLLVEEDLTFKNS